MGLAVGHTLDRATARALAREVRRAEALGVAVRTLRHRDLSRQRLEQRLAERGAPAGTRAEALATLERAGLVDDRRVAASRAAGLAERGYGDAAIRDALERDGFDAEDAREALAGLEPEPDRARRILAGSAPEPNDLDRSALPPTVLRRLAARGFGPETLENLGQFADDA